VLTPEAQTRSQRWWVVTTALAIWLGVHALRTYLAMSVWNLADELPLELKSIPPAAIMVIGLLAWPAWRLVGQRRSLLWFGSAFCAAYVLRALLGDIDRAASLFAFLGWILWLWWLPALLDGAARAGLKRIIAPAAVLGLSLQLAGQTLLHGLDAPLLRGVAGIVLPCALGAALFWSNLQLKMETEAEAEPFGRAAAALLGPWLFLELTLFANVGRGGALSGASLIAAATTAQLGLAIGLVLAAVEFRAQRIIAAIVLVLGSAFAAFMQGYLSLTLVAAHAACVVLFAGACNRGVGAGRSRVHTGAFAGAGLLFVFLFSFYTRYEDFGVWPLAGVALALCAFGKGTPSPRYYARFGFVIPLIASLAALGALVPPRGRPNTARTGLRLLTYNIHQGYDSKGLPSAQRIADVIAASDADVVALQEVGRGWDLLGGADLVAYLQRFPRQRVLFVPLNGQLWGNAIVTRMSVLEHDGAAFSVNEPFRYGFAHAKVGSSENALDIYSVHLSADLSTRVDDIRSQQARELISIAGHTRSVILGDFNAEPNSPVIVTLLGAGWKDAAAEFGLADARTWPAGDAQQRLDYVFLTPDLAALGARVFDTTASDHLPVQVDLSYNRALAARHR
jgi:endonuclease/exonuclease/phosphatase family metal-dependent hydrolase